MGGSYYLIPYSIISTGKDHKTPQRCPDIPTTSWIISIQSMDSLQGLTPESPSRWHRPLAPKDLALYDNESWNDPRDFAKLVKAITLPQDVPITSNRRLIELETQVQCLMVAHFAPTQPTQVNKITTLCEICNGPHDIQYCMENPEQAFVDNASSRTDEAGGKWNTFKPEENNLGDTYNPSWRSHPNLRLSKFKADFKQQQSEMTNKIDTVLKAITDRIAGTLPSDTVKNPKLGATPVLSARSYPTEDPQCLTHIYSSINAITIHPKQPEESQVNKPGVGQERKGNLGNINSNPRSQPDPLSSIATKQDLALYDNESWNDPRDFAKSVKAIALPQVQCLMVAHLAPTQPTQVNKITTLYEICNGPHDIQYCMENPEQAFVDNASSRTDEAGGKWNTFKPEENNLGDTHNPSWRSHPNLSSINAITIHPKQPEESQVNKPGVGQERKGNLGNINSNPRSQPDPLSSIATKQRSNVHRDHTRSYEIIRDDDEPQNKSLNEGEGATTEGPTVEYLTHFQLEMS
nr:hypothetical protein [Tanacetum cinerariifolium]